jgi:hypothetical protein
MRFNEKTVFRMKLMNSTLVVRDSSEFESLTETDQGRMCDIPGQRTEFNL